MRYLLSKEFKKISETSGTIQNASNIRTLEMTTFAVPNSGILIPPLRTHTFTGTTIYLRCVDGWAEARVVPFIVDGGGRIKPRSLSNMGITPPTRSEPAAKFTDSTAKTVFTTTSLSTTTATFALANLAHSRPTTSSRPTPLLSPLTLVVKEV